MKNKDHPINFTCQLKLQRHISGKVVFNQQFNEWNNVDKRHQPSTKNVTSDNVALFTYCSPK